MTVAEEITLEIPGLTLRGKAWGPADGRPVLGLHGWLDNAATHDRLAPLLPGCRVVALDLPGHGRSEHRAQGPYHFIDYVADTIHALDALGWEKASLLGHSMGAGISSLVAGAIPDRIVRTALIEGLGPLAEQVENTAKRVREAVAMERNKGAPKRIFSSMEEAAEKVAQVQNMDLDSARLLVARGVGPVEGGFTWTADSKVRSPSRLRLTEEQVLDFMQHAAKPTLLVLATDGWPYRAEMMERRVAALPNAQTVTLEGRHHLHLDHPDAVAAEVAPFLTGD